VSNETHEVVTNLQVQLETIRETAKTERQKNLLNLFGTVVNALIGVLNAVLLITNHSDTVSRVTEAKREVSAEVQRVYDDTPSLTQVQDLQQNVKANLLQWKAYKTKNPDDEVKAAELLTKATEGME